MKTFVEQKRFVRDISGPAASVLLILLLSGRSLTAIELEDATGYSDKSVAAGLRRLEEYGLVQNNGRANGWSLVAGRMPLPLPLMELDATTGLTQDAAWSDSADAETAVGPQDAHPSGKLSTGNGALSTGAARNGAKNGAEIGNSDLADSVVVVVLNNTDQEFKQQQQQETGVSGLDLAETLRRLRITGKAFGELMRQRVDAAEVVGWYWYACAQEWASNPAGYAVARMREGVGSPLGYAALARWWYGLAAEEQALVRSHLRGEADGEWLHARPESFEDLEYWLDGAVALPGEAAVAAMLELSQRREEVL